MNIGIVIPYYENSKEAKERLMFLLDILSKQITNFYKVVVVDDGCNCTWLDNYIGIKIIHIEHGGVSKARNTGMEYLIKEKCKYIGFVDADDSISNDYFREAYKVCQLNKYDIIDCRFVQSGIEVFGTLDNREWQKQTLRNGCAGNFFKTSKIKNHRFVEGMSTGEDGEFVNRAFDLSRDKKGTFDGMYVYNYGVNPKSIIMRASRNEDVDK